MKSKNITIALAALGLIGGAFRSEATLADYQSSVLATPSLISYYQFDGSTANDNFGANNGTMGGGASYVSGVAGGSALNFTGTSYDNFGAVSAFNFTDGTGSMEMWVQADWATSPGRRTIVGNGDGVGTFNYTISMAADKSDIVMWNGLGWWSMPISGVGTGWHHLGVVFDAATFTIVWDGVSQVNPYALALNGISGYTQLGSDLPSGGGWISYPWSGNLDEVAFYSDALSTSSIQDHYAAMSSVPEPTTMSLMLAAAGICFLRTRRQASR